MVCGCEKRLFGKLKVGPFPGWCSSGWLGDLLFIFIASPRQDKFAFMGKRRRMRRTTAGNNPRLGEWQRYWSMDVQDTSKGIALEFTPDSSSKGRRTKEAFVNESFLGH